MVKYVNNIPQHIAIIMDGNGRWALNKKLSRTRGHKAALKSVQEIISMCGEKGIKILTLFAFGMENWKRPSQEVRNIFRLFVLVLSRDIYRLHAKKICVRVLGDRAMLLPSLQNVIDKAERLTKNNNKLLLNIMVNYSGRWDLLRAVRILAQKVHQEIISAEEIEEFHISQELVLNSLPAPDLLIRTGGMQRISNFVLWELAYTELYFTETLWPDFHRADFEAALQDYAKRERRFGLTSQQVQQR